MKTEIKLLKQLITVLVQSTIGGPGGVKLKPGKVVSLEDSTYVRILVKSGSVALIDPPSLDPEYLEKAGYEFKNNPAPPVKTPPAKMESTKSIDKKAVESFLTKIKSSEEPSTEGPKEEEE